MDEVLTPFYIFQYFSIGLWVFGEAYYAFSIALLIITILSIISSIYDTYQSNNRIRQMAEQKGTINVKRMGGIRKINSNDLVPGDIVMFYEAEVKDSYQLPCDMVLIKGRCVTNESILTGESVPVAKAQIDEASEEVFNST